MNVLRPVLALASPRFVGDIRASLDAHGVPRAVADHGTPEIFNWIMSLVALQGISDAAAMTFQRAHGSATWSNVQATLASNPSCPRLRAYWAYECRYRKTSRTCLEPDHTDRCAVPRLALRKGALNEAAYSLALFIRDIADGDLVGWIDRRLAAHDAGADAPERAAQMRTALLEPLCEIRGVGAKVWSMVLADLLLAGDPDRETWVSVGASMIAVDRLVHAFLARSGLIDRFGVRHAVGPACYGLGGCASAINEVARRFDARTINRAFPAVFPRLVQHSIWAFCAADQWNICNANQIDDRAPCDQRFCPCFCDCDRVAIGRAVTNR